METEAGEQHILGSAERLTPVQREVRLRELAEWGVDLSLSYAQLHKSADERLDEWLAVYAFAQEAARARLRGRIFSPIESGGRKDNSGALRATITVPTLDGAQDSAACYTARMTTGTRSACL